MSQEQSRSLFAILAPQTKIPVVQRYHNHIAMEYPAIKDLVFLSKPFEVMIVDKAGEIKTSWALAQKERWVKEWILITLSSADRIECSLDSPVVLRDGSYKLAQDLKEGDEIMPFIFSFDSDGFLNVVRPQHDQSQQYRRTIRAVEKMVKSNDGYRLAIAEGQGVAVSSGIFLAA